MKYTGWCQNDFLKCPGLSTPGRVATVLEIPMSAPACRGARSSMFER